MNKSDMIQKIYSLSPMQEGMLLYTLMDSDKHKKTYFEQQVFEINGQLDINVFEESINKIVERHDILRTVFINSNIPVQVVLKENKVSLDFTNICNLEESKQIDFIDKFKNDDIDKGFNLSKKPPIRFSLLKVEKDKFIYIQSFHHIISDGWSSPILFNELLQIYYALKNNQSINLPKVKQYGEYIAWLEKQNEKEALSYWKEYLNSYETQASIPTLPGNFNKDEYINKNFKLCLSKEVTDKVRDLAKSNSVTVNTIFQTIWGILLQKYNNSSDAVFGAVVSGRPAEIEGIGNMVGLFINTVPVRIQDNHEKSFIEIVKDVQKNDVKSKQYEYESLAEIQSQTSLKDKLIDTIMVFENYPVLENNEDSENQYKLDVNLKEALEQTNYNLDISVYMMDKTIVTLSYNGSVYGDEYVKDMGYNIEKIVNEILENPHKKICDIDMLCEDEKKKIMIDFNNTKSDYDKDKTIYELFEERADISPNNTALVYGADTLTYKELNEKSNALAYSLRERGAGPDKIVGIMAEQSLEMIVGMMAILKSGSAYLPIDPNYPEERIKYMLDDSRTNILLTQSNLKDKVQFGGTIIEIDKEESYSNDTRNIKKINKCDNLAYIIYTSGTTGKPKGVMIEHKNAVKYMNSFFNEFDLTSDDVMLQQASICFDTSVEEIYPILLRGGKLVIENNYNLLNKDYLKEVLDKNNITIVSCAPHIFNEIIELNYIGELRILISGGDKLNLNTSNYTNSNCRLYNTFGPTEGTVCATYYEIKDRNLDNIPIGKPISNTRIYILNKQGKLQPIGIPGEICIAGDGVARGYLNREDLTEEKFVKNPYEESGKMYKTGDLGRWLPDGNIEFLGRIDYQVKIRGFRIELGEIENLLLKHECVKEAVVIDKTDKNGEKYLCAYFVSNKELTVKDLRDYVSKEVPNYMVPAYFIQLEKIPLTLNGKVDRKSLPEPKGDINTGVEYTAPRNELEKKLLNVWKQVLGVEKISIDDDFFALGGHSIKALEAASKINTLRIPLKVSEVYKYPTIRKLSEFINPDNSEMELGDNSDADDLIVDNDSNVINGITSNDDKYTWEELDCFNRTLAIIFKYFKKEYFNLLLFNISFYSSFIADNELSAVLDGGNEDIMTNFYEKVLYDKFKIRINKVEYSNEKDMREKIKDSIDNDRPVLLPGDLFGLYYYPMYKNKPHFHYFIIKGYDTRREIYYILDNLHINNGSSTIYKDFTSRFDDMYAMNKLYFDNFATDITKHFFWNLSNERTNEEYYDVYTCIMDHYNFLKAAVQDDSKVNYVECEIMKRIENSSEKNPEKIKKLVGSAMAMINFKAVYYDLTLKFLELLNGDKKLISQMKDMQADLVSSWNSIRFNILDNVGQGKYEFDEIKKNISPIIDKEKTYRDTFIKAVESIDDVKGHVKQSRIFFNNYEFAEYNNNNAKIITADNNITFNLDEHKTYDIWLAEDNGPQLLNNILNNEDFTIEGKFTLGKESPEILFHDGIISKFSKGITILFGIIKEHEQENKLAIYCPQKGDDYVILEVPYIKKKNVYLKLSKKGSKYAFYYKEKDNDKWNTMKCIDLKQNIKNVGFFAKKWQFGEHIVSISDISYSKNN